MSTQYTQVNIIDVSCDVEGCGKSDTARKHREHDAEKELMEKGWKLVRNADRLFGKGLTLCPKHNVETKLEEGK